MWTGVEDAARPWRSRSLAEGEGGLLVSFAQRSGAVGLPWADSDARRGPGR